MGWLIGIGVTCFFLINSILFNQEDVLCVSVIVLAMIVFSYFQTAKMKKSENKNQRSNTAGTYYAYEPPSVRAKKRLDEEFALVSAAEEHLNDVKRNIDALQSGKNDMSAQEYEAQYNKLSTQLEIANDRYQLCKMKFQEALENYRNN